MNDKRISECYRIYFKMLYDDGDFYCAGYVEDVFEIGMFFCGFKELKVGVIVILELVEDFGDVLFEI